MNDAATASPVATEATAGPGQLYYRHRLPVRVMHWINVVALTILFMSGLNIFEAHPALYWGASSSTGRPPLLEIGAREGEAGAPVGYTRVFGHEFDTTGVLGVHGTGDAMTTDAFPAWLTIPSGRWLSMARAFAVNCAVSATGRVSSVMCTYFPPNILEIVLASGAASWSLRACVPLRRMIPSP